MRKKTNTNTKQNTRACKGAGKRTGNGKEPAKRRRKPGEICYYVENGKRPRGVEATSEFVCSKYLVQTKLELKGQGIKCNGRKNDKGENVYLMTPRAYQKFTQDHSVANGIYFD